MQRDSEVERQENAAKQKRMEGLPVNYGDNIQLLHTFTGKYMCVSTTDTSLTENTKLKVRKRLITSLWSCTILIVVLNRSFFRRQIVLGVFFVFIQGSRFRWLVRK